MRRLIPITALSLASALALTFACGEELATGTATELDAAPEAAANEAASDSSVPVEAAATCDLSAPFGAPVVLGPGTVSTDLWETTVSLTADELMMAIGRYNSATTSYDLVIASRPNRTAPFGPPVLLSELSANTQDTHPWISTDGLTLIFARLNESWDIYEARRANRTDPFGAPFPVLASDAGHEFEPNAGAAGTELFYDDTSDIFRAPRSSDGMVGAATKVELNGEAGSRSSFPVLSSDALALYFSSDTNRGAGNIEIFVAHRPDASATAFGPPSVVGELNGGAQQFPGWLSPDGCRMYFTSNRLGTWDVYLATRP